MLPDPETLEKALRAARFRGEIRLREPLGPCTTWRIGGPADLLVQPADLDDLIAAVRWAAADGIPWRILGNGSNVLVRDEGVRGLVIRLRRVLDAVEFRGTRVVSGAGASLPAVANLAAERGLSGLEFAGGIPGTLGGAVIMNAGWHAHEIGNVVVSVEYLEPDGTVARWPREACAFGYRASAFHGRAGVVLGAEIELRPEDPATIRATIAAYAASRKASQPTEVPSCGSVFLKPEGDFAGRLIEQAGLKGVRVGDLQVSLKHANFFVNLGRGTAADALALVERVEREVLEKFGVKLVREFEVW